MAGRLAGSSVSWYLCIYVCLFFFFFFFAYGQDSILHRLECVHIGLYVNIHVCVSMDLYYISFIKYRDLFECVCKCIIRTLMFILLNNVPQTGTCLFYAYRQTYMYMHTYIRVYIFCILQRFAMRVFIINLYTHACILVTTTTDRQSSSSPQ